MAKLSFFHKVGWIKQAFLPAIAIAISLIVFGWFTQSKPDKVSKKRAEKSWLVSAVAVNIDNLSPEITIYGQVETSKQATLKSALVADVVEVNILEGETVEAGQILVKLDDTDLALTLRQREASVDEINALVASELSRYQRDKALLEHETGLLDLADRAVKRAKKLKKTQLASQENLDKQLADKARQQLTIQRLQYDIDNHPARLAKLKAQRANYQALLEQTKVNLKRTKILAPFAGRIAMLDIAVGDRVSAGTQLLSLYSLDNFEVRAQLPNRYIAGVRASLARDEPLKASTIAGDEQTLNFVLTRLAGEIHKDSGGVDGLFSVASGDTSSLTIGKFVELSLKLSPEQSVIAIPFNALYGLDRVYRIDDGYLQSVKVTRVGEYRPSIGKKMLLIRSAGLKEGDNIVSTQLPNVSTGLKVRVLDSG